MLFDTARPALATIEKLVNFDPLHLVPFLECQDVMISYLFDDGKVRRSVIHYLRAVCLRAFCRAHKNKNEAKGNAFHENISAQLPPSKFLFAVKIALLKVTLERWQGIYAPAESTLRVELGLWKRRESRIDPTQRFLLQEEPSQEL